MAQTSFLGDVILSTPVISGIKKIYPEAVCWMMTTPLSAALVIRDPLLAGVLIDDKKEKKAGLTGLLKMKRQIKDMAFDRVYSLHRSHRTALLLWLSRIPLRIGFADAKLNFLYHETRKRNPKDHDVIRNLSLLSGEVPLRSLDSELRLYSPEYDELGDDTKQMLPNRGAYVVLVPGSVWKTKMWHWEGYREVAKFMLKKGYNIVLLGAKVDRNVNTKVSQGLKIINLTGKTNIADAMYVIKHSKLVVCNDSMALHLASAFKIPNVAIFCATSPEFGFSPWKNNAIVVEKKDLDCKPCQRHGGKICPTGTEACMKELSHVDVIYAAEKLLKIQ
ncbi:MAG: glycosyltransferase family 9 protein [Desulfobacterales bacterium]|nr:MAG: glycosyltransferase family 9 protein [Desulfobacterales bacterium]